MSLRALKKRDTQLIQSSFVTSSANRTAIFKKATTTSPKKRSLAKTLTNTSLYRQRQLLGRSAHSNPELTNSYKEFQRAIEANNLLRSKSEGDVSSTKALASHSTAHTLLTAANAKSEVCLQSISSHSYETQQLKPATTTTTTAGMLGGARSHRDLMQSSYDPLEHSGRQPRRMSECSSGGYSRRASSSIFASQMTLSSSAVASVDPNAVLRVPIIGYEVMEERARFTVYKLRVENPATNDCWLVMRRYTDFVRLNGKLKQAFPHTMLLLPRKKLFGDNFNAVFLDNRVQGLQIFVNSVMAKEELRKCKLVREFFCLDEPPSYSESMEECRAIFEAQEETIAHMKLQVQSKNDLILSLQQKLREEMAEKEQLKEAMKNVNLNCSHCSSANNSVALK